jgi:hypothetical protein
MQKIMRFVGATALTWVLSLQISYAQAPTESQAGMKDEEILLDLPTPAPIVAEEKERPAQVFQKQMQAQHPAWAKKMEKATRFLDSKIGNWVLKRTMAKAEQKAIRKAKKHPDKLQEAQKISRNMRIIAVLGITGVVLSLFFKKTLRIIGIVLMVAALVFLIIELI